ncbi:FKBP-type peptidyl-prolyl cis-trans isomerase [Vibrio cholerae]|nr:FKBP-type peptidyl-prolyl cis-trans isomerase [Vibrio cholerae]EMC7820279.1 FKBP-type peptidyl-prolyl cis-trans isomerase [Vibrio cholerae]
MLVHTNHEYDNYEPIWVSSMDKATKNIRVHAFVDVTHRVFGIQSLRTPPYTPNSSDSVQYPEQQMIAPQLSSYQQTNDRITIGDRVNIDFQGRIDGVAFEGGKANNFPLVVGEGRMIHGFEDGLVGKKVGDVFDIEITFPDDYHAESLKGKVAVFSIVVNKTERRAENELV